MKAEQMIQLTATLAEIKTQLISMDASLKSTADKLQHLDERLFTGNGSPAILSNLDKRIALVEDAQARRVTQMALLWTAIVGISVAVVSDVVVRHISPDKQTVNHEQKANK